MADTEVSAEPKSPPHTNGMVGPDGMDEEDRQKMRPADIDADVKEMERRKRVDMIMSSKLFREELERIIETQLRDGTGTASGLMQQISDMMGVPRNAGNAFKSSNCVVPINDIRGIEAMGYAKGEKILRCKLAAVYRLVDLYGWTQGTNALITARLNQDEEHFLVNPYGMLFHEITASSLIKVDMQGQVVEQGTTNFSVNVASFSLHAAIHSSRPDIKCIIHVRTPSVVAISALKCGILPISEQAVVIGETSSHLHLGGILSTEEIEKIARNLGPNNKVLILTNQGIVCCGETIEEAFFNARNTVLACEQQLKLMPIGLDNLVLITDEQRKKLYDQAHKAPESTPRPDQPSVLEGKVERKWRVGGVEFEALMRMLDNAGFRTGYIYRHPLVKGEPPKPKNDVEVPPAVSSLGYLLEEEELYRQGLWKKLEGGKKGTDRTRWLNSPNVYQKVEILETGTPDPKKITKWVADGSPTHSSTPVKIENALQFVPKNTNPKEFKLLQQQIKDYRRADKISAGPQSHILEGVTWEEAKKMQDATVTQTGDQVVLMGAASKGIIQRGFQHNATMYKSPYAKNPFDCVTDEELDEYKRVVERKARGEFDDTTDYSESEGLSSAQINKRISDIRSPTSVASETEEESRDEPQVLRIETTQAPKPSQPEVVMSDDDPVSDQQQYDAIEKLKSEALLQQSPVSRASIHSTKSQLKRSRSTVDSYRTTGYFGHPKGSYLLPNPRHFHIANVGIINQVCRPKFIKIPNRKYGEFNRKEVGDKPTVTINIGSKKTLSLDISMNTLRDFIAPFASALNLRETDSFQNVSCQTSYRNIQPSNVSIVELNSSDDSFDFGSSTKIENHFEAVDKEFDEDNSLEEHLRAFQNLYPVVEDLEQRSTEFKETCTKELEVIKGEILAARDVLKNAIDSFDKSADTLVYLNDLKQHTVIGDKITREENFDKNPTAEKDKASMLLDLLIQNADMLYSTDRSDCYDTSPAKFVSENELETPLDNQGGSELEENGSTISKDEAGSKLMNDVATQQKHQAELVLSCESSKFQRKSRSKLRKKTLSATQEESKITPDTYEVPQSDVENKIKLENEAELESETKDESRSDLRKKLRSKIERNPSRCSCHDISNPESEVYQKILRKISKLRSANVSQETSTAGNVQQEQTGRQRKVRKGSSHTKLQWKSRSENSVLFRTMISSQSVVMSCNKAEIRNELHGETSSENIRKSESKNQAKDDAPQLEILEKSQSDIQEKLLEIKNETEENPRLINKADSPYKEEPQLQAESTENEVVLKAEEKIECENKIELVSENEMESENRNEAEFPKSDKDQLELENKVDDWEKEKTQLSVNLLEKYLLQRKLNEELENFWALKRKPENVRPKHCTIRTHGKNAVKEIIVNDDEIEFVDLSTVNLNKSRCVETQSGEREEEIETVSPKKVRTVDVGSSTTSPPRLHDFRRKKLFSTEIQTSYQLKVEEVVDEKEIVDTKETVDVKETVDTVATKEIIKKEDTREEKIAPKRPKRKHIFKEPEKNPKQLKHEKKRQTQVVEQKKFEKRKKQSRQFKKAEAADLASKQLKSRDYVVQLHETFQKVLDMTPVSRISNMNELLDTIQALTRLLADTPEGDLKNLKEQVLGESELSTLRTMVDEATKQLPVIQKTVKTCKHKVRLRKGQTCVKGMCRSVPRIEDYILFEDVEKILGKEMYFPDPSVKQLSKASKKEMEKLLFSIPFQERVNNTRNSNGENNNNNDEDNNNSANNDTATKDTLSEDLKGTYDACSCEQQLWDLWHTFIKTQLTAFAVPLFCYRCRSLVHTSECIPVVLSDFDVHVRLNCGMCKTLIDRGHLFMNDILSSTGPEHFSMVTAMTEKNLGKFAKLKERGKRYYCQTIEENIKYVTAEELGLERIVTQMSTIINTCLMKQWHDLEGLEQIQDLSRNINVEKMFSQLSFFYKENCPAFPHNLKSDLRVLVNMCLRQKMVQSFRATCSDEKLFKVEKFIFDIFDKLYGWDQKTDDEDQQGENANDPETLVTFQARKSQSGNESYWISVAKTNEENNHRPSPKKLINVDDIPLKPPDDLIEEMTQETFDAHKRFLSPIPEENDGKTRDLTDYMAGGDYVSYDRPDTNVVVSNETQFFRSNSAGNSPYVQSSCVTFVVKDEATKGAEHNEEYDDGNWMGYSKAEF